MQYSDNHIEFLDTTLRCNAEGQLSTTLYCKDNDSHNYLQFSSAHPETVKKGLPYSEFLRVKRICSNEEECDKNIALLAAHFMCRGYPIDILDSAYSRVKDFSRDSLLETEIDPPLDEERGDNSKKVFSITTYNPVGCPNKQIIRTNWDMLGTSNTTMHLYEHRVIHGQRRCQNLRDLLVHAKLKIQVAPRAAISGSSTNVCSNRNCRYCPKLNKTGTILSPATGRSYKCCHNISCCSTNVIYCLKCTECNKLYVGQTKRPLKKRMVEHFSDINKKDPTKPLGQHFAKPNHSDVHVLEIYILKFIKRSPDSAEAQWLRDYHELQWIHRLKSSLPFGLNSMD